MTVTMISDLAGALGWQERRGRLARRTHPVVGGCYVDMEAVE